jgi:hypothetical protein
VFWRECVAHGGAWFFGKREEAGSGGWSKDEQGNGVWQAEFFC